MTDSKNKLPKTLIIQSNNEIPKLRKEVTKLGYYIEDENLLSIDIKIMSLLGLLEDIKI